MAANSQTEPNAPKRRGMTLIGGVLLLVCALFFIFLGEQTHKLELKAYFDNAQGLQVGAPVRVAGVDVGNVVSVRVRPERREAAAEVIMRIYTPYQLQIPKDAVAVLATAGVLGETFVDIDIVKASGAPAQTGDELRTAGAATPSGEFELYFGSRRKGSQNEVTVPPRKSTPKQ